MSFWLIVSSVLALIWLLDALRLRKRLLHLKVLTPQDAPVAEDLHAICRKGVTLDEATQKAASAWMQAHKLNVLVLLPYNLPSAEALLGIQTLDPASFQNDRIVRAKCMGEAIMVRQSLLQNFDGSVEAPQDSLAFARLAHEFKKYASTSMDIALVPWLEASPRHWQEHGPLVSFVHGAVALPAILMQIVLLVLGLFLAPWIGVLAFVCYHAQPLLVFRTTAMRPKGLWRFSLLRIAFDLATVLSALRKKAENPVAGAEDQRTVYRELLAHGTAPFFEAARLDCPLCGASNLSTAVSSRDLIQFKPGIFTISRCMDCQHLFQNPRLSIEGLNFYYKDFYDGLGEEQTDRVFSFGSAPYLARARMLKGTPKPRRWLDVGAGHGHFCCVARDVWPGVPFDGLDLSQGVENASKRGWVDRAYRGLFPELADSLAQEGAYDVISMSHYLEHTRDPDSEIAAAAKVLPQGGHLLIELPDPECRLGVWFGSFWVPWFQPQHQHMLSAANLDRLLKAHSFESLEWHRGEAHQPVDFLFSTILFLNKIAPPVDFPWRSPATWPQKIWHKSVFILCFPLLIIARLMDKAMAPMLRRPGWSNTFRVLARRTA